MELTECVTTRSVTRGFKADPVPRGLLQELLDQARNCMSAENTQPWEFAVFGGTVMEAMRKDNLERFETGAAPAPEIPYSGDMWPEAFRGRIMGGDGPNLLEVMKIDPADKAARQQLWRRGIGFWGAPNGIVIYMERDLPQLSLLDIGGMLTTLTLLAHGQGLGTCPILQMVMWPDITRRHLKIPDSKLIVIGLSIGYPDPADPINRFKSFRLPLDDMVSWHE
jgi:nitroreductase